MSASGIARSRWPHSNQPHEFSTPPHCHSSPSDPSSPLHLSTPSLPFQAPSTNPLSCPPRDKASGAELEVQEKQPLLEYLAENYKKWGCVMEFVTDRSQEGSQFCRGFGGIGGLLRYAVDLTELEEPTEDFGEMWDEDAW